MKTRTAAVLTLALIAWPAWAQDSEDSGYPIAGSTPWQRPEGAPSIEWVTRDVSWYEHSLTGIERPYPRSLWFLDNQGYWYTPFNRPGALPPYDLRDWHR